MAMENDLYKPIHCPHCSGKGTCFNENNASCGTCLKESKHKYGSKIVVCSVCGGCGIAELKTARLLNRIPFLIVFIVLVVFYLYVGLSVFRNDAFDKIFPLIGSLTTMIVTFYFAQRKQ